MCLFVFVQGACHDGCVSKIGFVDYVSVGIGDCHGPVWHRGELAIFGPVVFMPSCGLGFLDTASPVPFGSCTHIDRLQSWGRGTHRV